MPIQNQIYLSPDEHYSLFRLKDERDIHLFIDHNRGIKPSDKFTKTGFIFHPFHLNQQYPEQFCEATAHYVNPEVNIELPGGSLPSSTPKKEYIEQCQLFIDSLNAEVQKLVLSRILNVKNDQSDIFSAFLEMCRQYPNAFIYIYNHPVTGCWIGASPEVLLTSQRGKSSTMALAGTQHKDKKKSWTSKELEEQDYVSIYIKSILESLHIDFDWSGPFDHPAGELIHLLTQFNFPTPDNYWKLLNKLHPTPAVCGLPADQAKKIIFDKEIHDRAYYSGYLGPVNFRHSNTLFVNLRCMQASKQEFALYLGGGIVKGSIPALEWEETENKSRTLLNVFRHR